jgi:tetratricopeptide (TPR) repeat protein
VLSAINADRYAVAEKHLRLLLQHVDETSVIDRFELRVALVNVLRLQCRLLDAANECVAENGDSVEQQIRLLSMKSFLLMRCKGELPPHDPLNTAAALSAKLEEGSREQAKLVAIIFALQVLIRDVCCYGLLLFANLLLFSLIQGTVSVEAGNYDQALERVSKGLSAVRKWQSDNSSSSLTMELGDLLTVRGRALLGNKTFLSAEESLDEALAAFEVGVGAGKEGRAAEALLALGTLYKETSSMMYAEGVYRRLMRIISVGGVDSEHVHASYDAYAWFLRSQKRVTEAEDIEKEYIRLYLKQ